MDVQARPDALPEVQEVLGSCQGRVQRPEGTEALERYRTGLLTELPHKNCETIARAVPGTSEQRRQAFLTNLQGDDEDLTRQRGHKTMAEAALGDGGLVLEEPGFPTQGKAAVGVARQDAGTLGQVGNCQLAGTWCDPEPQATWPVAVRWSLPKAWAAEPDRRGKARLPDAGPVQTTPEIALTRRDQARAWRVPHRCVVAAADDGDHPHCLAGLEARQARDVVGVRADCRVSPQRQRGRPAQRAAQRLQAVPRWQWRTIRGRHGSQGWRRQQCIAVRGWRLTSDGQRHVGWLVGERATRGQPEERQDHWRNRPVAAPLEALAGDAHWRSAVEPFHAEAPGEWGWEQYQGRLWPGFHRHAVTVLRAYSVLGWLELRQRRGPRGRGRPRDPLSPSPGPAAAHAAGGPSGGRPLAPPPSRPVVGDHRSVHRTRLTTVLTK
jgi:SRSO17 transposase